MPVDAAFRCGDMLCRRHIIYDISPRRHFSAGMSRLSLRRRAAPISDNLYDILPVAANAVTLIEDGRRHLKIFVLKRSQLRRAISRRNARIQCLPEFRR